MRAGRLSLLVVVASLVVLCTAGQALAVSPNLVVSQVYGGGGNGGATYTHDFIEIFNRGTASASLAGMSLQYASATGTGNFGASSTQLTELPSVTLAPGQYLLVQEASTAAVGAPLPTADVLDPTPIAMGAAAGKVALVTGTDTLGCNGGSAPCDGAALVRIVDLVGYGNANFFEGGAAAAALSSTTAALRAAGGCTDTDSNASDFAASTPTPRNTATALAPCTGGDAAPAVSATTPADGATGVAVDANVSITFSEPVDVTGSWFSISCATSGAHAAAASGGPTTVALDPATDFAQEESCAVTVFAGQVTDQDTDDPPDAMAANHVFSFTTAGPPVRIREIQGAAHLSLLVGTFVSGVEGIVTAKSGNGFWLQDPNPDANDATSEGIFVFTNSAPTVEVGDALAVAGSVAEFRPGGAAGSNLTTTELTGPTLVVRSSGNALPAATVVGAGGRTPPTTVIEDDATGSVEASGVFDPAADGIDFYESLEGMRVQVNDPRAVGPTNGFGEIAVVGDGGAGASVFTPRGGLVIGPDDFNPERVILDDVLRPTPVVNVGDGFDAAAVGVLDYSFGNFKLLVTDPLTGVPGGLARETTAAAGPGELSVATFNVENLDPNDPPAKFAELAELIVDHLAAPDLLSLEEVQDDNGPTNNGVVGATATLNQLVAAISAAGGPAYSYRQIDPVNNEDGGEPGGNIRVAFLFRTDRGLAFVDRPGGTSTAAVGVVAGGSGPELTFSPGRIDPEHAAFTASRKPLAGELTFHGARLFVVANHFNSKGGDDPLFGRFQPPNRVTEVQRHQQAELVNGFVDSVLALDSDANVLVLGDLNDFQFSETLEIVEGGVLTNLYSTIPAAERYSYVFDGNSQALDHIVVSDAVLTDLELFDPVHVNAEFAEQASDHDPLVGRFCADETGPALTVTLSRTTLWPPNHRYVSVTATTTGSDSADPSPTVELVSVTSNEPDDAPGGADGNTLNDVVVDGPRSFRLRAERNENGSGRVYTVTYRSTDACGNQTPATAEVTVPITSP
jgi:predicted extracellular nuclease